MKRVLIINGVARSGKDTFVDAIIERSEGKAMKMSTVDKIKEVSKIFGVGIRKSNKERRFWSDIKDAWTRYNNGPFNEIIELINTNKKNKNIFCVFVREPEEIAKFKRYYKEECVTVLVTRPNTDVPSNHADEEVNDYNYDCEICNSSEKDCLVAMAQHFADTIFDE